MRWGRGDRAAPRPRRPKTRKMTKDEQQKLLESFTAQVAKSPVLVALGCQVAALRGRFHIERVIDEEQRELWGRITPLDDSSQCLLEGQRRENHWYEIATGGPQKLIAAIAGDTRGTFHGLGSVDASLRKADAGLVPLNVKRQGKSFVYAATGRRCTAQEALFHYFRIPVDVLIQPRGWYIRHRTPNIVEHSPDRSRVLVRFVSDSALGDPIVGTCLYLRHEPPPRDNAEPIANEPTWGAYSIRPNAADTIATAEAWIVKRKWKPW